MNRSKTYAPVATYLLGLYMLAGTEICHAAGQSSPSYRIEADVQAIHRPGLAVGTPRTLASISAGQRSLAGVHSSTSFHIAHGYQATTEGFDSDGDGIPDHQDPDSDGDGVPDHADDSPYDFNGNGIPNVLDPDIDGDHYSNWKEWLAGTNPYDPGDFLQWLSVERHGGQVRIVWRAKPDQFYIIERSTNLTVGSNWTAMPGPIQATGTVMSITDTNTTPFIHYRVSIP